MENVDFPWFLQWLLGVEFENVDFSLVLVGEIQEGVPTIVYTWVGPECACRAGHGPSPTTPVLGRPARP